MTELDRKVMSGGGPIEVELLTPFADGTNRATLFHKFLIVLDEGTAVMTGSSFHIDYAFEIWVSRTSYANEVLWSRTYLGEEFSFDYAGGIAVGAGGAIYLSGSADLDDGRAAWVAELTR